MTYNNHTFAICAYKESPFLEDCVKSILNQTVQSNVIMCTSTPNDSIQSIAAKYNIPLFVSNEPSNIKDDWNRAYNRATTDYVTIVHQDDVYTKTYLEEFENKLSSDKNNCNSLIFITDYLPLKNGTNTKRDINCKIRRFLRTPLKSKHLSQMSIIKKGVLAFGNSICCPCVTYNKKLLGESIFTSKYKFNIDWDTFLKLAKMNGRFLYIDKPLFYYRIHDGATSKEFIENNNRYNEDFQMFLQFWPKWVAKFIMLFYIKAYDTYEKET